MNGYVFFTDGLTETFNDTGKMLGMDGVKELVTITCVGGVFETAACLLERLEVIRNGLPIDDLTLIIAELK